MIGVLATIKINPGSNSDFEEIAKKMVKAVRANEMGNVYYNFYKGEDDNTYVVMERYKGQEDLDAHGKTEHMRSIGSEMGKHMSGAPEIKILKSL